MYFDFLSTSEFMCRFGLPLTRREHVSRAQVQIYPPTMQNSMKKAHLSTSWHARTTWPIKRPPRHGASPSKINWIAPKYNNYRGASDIDTLVYKLIYFLI